MQLEWICLSLYVETAMRDKYIHTFTLYIHTRRTNNKKKRRQKIPQCGSERTITLLVEMLLIDGVHDHCWMKRDGVRKECAHAHICMRCYPFLFYSIRSDLSSITSLWCTGIDVCGCVSVSVHAVSRCEYIVCYLMLLLFLFSLNIHSLIQQIFHRYRCAIAKERQTIDIHLTLLCCCVCTAEEFWCWHTRIYACITYIRNNKMHTNKHNTNVLWLMLRMYLYLIIAKHTFTGFHAFVVWWFIS